MKITIEGKLPRLFGITKAELRSAAELFAEHSSKRIGVAFQEITVILQNDAESAEAHLAINGAEGPTDVITQPYDAMPGELEGIYGEVYVNCDQALRVAPKRKGWSPKQELLLYIAHGMDHLSGADDLSPVQYSRMRRRELGWLRTLKGMRSVKTLMLLLTLSVVVVAESAEWIRPERMKRNASFVIAKDFGCGKKIEKAILKASAAGIGVWKLNGVRVGDAYYEPVVSYYEKRIYFREYDVTKLLRESNCIEAEVGGGWYDQNLAWNCERWNGQGCSYGRPAAWAELEIKYADGSVEMVATDGTWKAGDGRSVWNNIYGGEIIDARGGTAAEGKTLVAKDVGGKLERCPIPPCRIVKEFPASVRGAMGGRNDVWVYDFGTNLAGTVRFRLPPLVPGSRLKVRFAETVTKDGELDPRSLGSFANHCAPEYVYIAPDRPAATEFIPEFSYTSFRYAEVSGFEPFPDNAKNWGKAPPEDLLTGVMIVTDVKRREGGENRWRWRADGFCDQDRQRIQKFIDIADHTILCNLHGIPEDCPGREKGGWLGDAVAVCPYALATWDLESVYVEFLRDIADGTEIFGEIPCQVPTHRAFAWGAAPALWRCAAVGIPYQLYRQCGNEKVVREYWWLIEKCLDMFAKDAAKDGLVRWGYGDWIPPAGKDYRMPVAHSSNLIWIECLEQADYLAKRLQLKMKRDYAAEAKRVRAQFMREFFDEKRGTFGYDGTDAIAYNLGLADTMPTLLKRLAERDYMMTTGIYATPHLARALIRSGHREVMMKVLFNPKHASYQTVMDDGFTTCPENLSNRLEVSRLDEPQASLSHPMHCGWLAVLLSAEDPPLESPGTPLTSPKGL